jgi:hypothetical protein
MSRRKKSKRALEGEEFVLDVVKEINEKFSSKYLAKPPSASLPLLSLLVTCLYLCSYPGRPSGGAMSCQGPSE